MQPRLIPQKLRKAKGRERGRRKRKRKKEEKERKKKKKEKDIRSDGNGDLISKARANKYAAP